MSLDEKELGLFLGVGVDSYGTVEMSMQERREIELDGRQPKSTGNGKAYFYNIDTGEITYKG